MDDFLHNPQTTNNYRYETRQSCKNGQYVWVEVSSIYQYNDENELETVNNIRNISERKMAEEKLIANQRELSQQNRLNSTLLELIPMGVFMVEAPSGKPVLANEAAKRILGRGILPDATRQNLAEIYQAIKAESGKPYPTDQMPIILGMEGLTSHVEDMVIIDPSGINRQLEVFGSPVRDESNNVWASLVSFLDISDRKIAEKKLRDSEEKYRLIAENAKDVISIYNITKCKLTYISPSVETLRGFTPEEALELKWEDTISPDTFDLAESMITKNAEDFLNNPQSTNNYIYEIRQSCKNGEYIWVEISTTYQYNSQNELENVNIIRNIEERKKSEEKLMHLSYHDQLTDLYNRRFYEEELIRLDTERNLPMTLIMADVNGLKLTNDAFGHQAGDELLKNIAQIFKKVCRSDEIISRIGGDEFVILLPKCNESQTKLLIERLNAAITKNKKMNTLLSVSIGYAIKESVLTQMNEVFKEAEDDMYRHKLAENLSMRSKNIDLIMNSLFEKSNRERLHSDRVAEICEKIASNMNINQEGIQQIRIAAVLHDIGKIGISDSILNKKGKLDTTEWEEMKKHSEIGYRILSTVPEFSEIAEYVLSHQERWDGKGYPYNLKGEEIPIQARIIAIADAFDAMTVKRTYRDAMSETDAVAEIKKYAGTQFDPEIARIFVEKVMGLSWK